MAPRKRKTVSKQPEPHICDMIKDALKILKCPVCLLVMQEPPIYVCENPQGHSICSTCHGALKKDRKPCPVCSKPLADRRSLGLENMAEILPQTSKPIGLLPQTCKFEGCEFKSARAEMKKHQEEECENRFVPCAYCDDEVSVKNLAQHIVGKHDKKPLQGLDAIPLTCTKQTVLTNKADDQNPKFLFNWYKMDADTYMFWVSFIGPKTSAKNIRYTFKVRKEKKSEEYLSESTKRCVPCDLSHEKVKSMRCFVMLDQELIEDAKHKDGVLFKIYVSLAIHEP